MMCDIEFHIFFYFEEKSEWSEVDYFSVKQLYSLNASCNNAMFSSFDNNFAASSPPCHN